MDKLETYLVAGLGNPGTRYAKTRHNIGYLAVEQLAVNHNSNFSPRPELFGERSSFWLNSSRIILLKPQTYMNLSGRSVVRAVAEEQVPLHHLVVIHDDLDLTFGRIKIVFNRGDGGHNGVRSVIEEMEQRDFIRIKCGIARPREGGSVTEYVLSPFLAEEKEDLAVMLAKIERAVSLIVLHGKTAAMNEINSFD